MRCKSHLHKALPLLLLLSTHLAQSQDRFQLDVQPDLKVHLCAHLISHGRFFDAARVLTDIGHNSIATVVDRVYERNPNNSEVIMNFLKGLPNVQHQGFGYEALYNSMADSDALETPQAVLLHYRLEQVVETLRHFHANKDLKKRMFSLKDTLDTHLLNIHRMLYEGTSGEVEKFSKKQTTDSAIYLKHLVRSAYNSEVNNTAAILKFVIGLPFLGHAAIGYDKLYTEIERHAHVNGSHVFLVAASIKEAMDSSEFELSGPNVKEQFRELKNRLPSTVRRVLWDRVCIQSAVHGELLYPAGWIPAYDKKRRRLYTIQQSETERRRPQSHWRFVTSNKGATFRLHNLFHDESMFAGVQEFAYDSVMRRVFLLSGPTVMDEFQWALEYDHVAAAIRVKHVVTKEYLDSENESFPKRRLRRVVVTSTRGLQRKADASGWTVLTC